MNFQSESTKSPRFVQTGVGIGQSGVGRCQFHLNNSIFSPSVSLNNAPLRGKNGKLNDNFSHSHITVIMMIMKAYHHDDRPPW